MKQTIYHFVSLPILLVMAVCLSVGCGPAEQPEPKPTPTPTPTMVAVTGVTLNKATLTLVEGSAETLAASVSPDNATDKTVTWSTDNASVATVAEDGTVTAVAQGTATITAAAGEAKASCVITVIPSAYETERAALIAIYNATGGNSWERSDNWCSDKPIGQWYGVHTNIKGRVDKIDLHGNITGRIPPEIGEFSSS